jgi:hypothetical protein
VKFVKDPNSVLDYSISWASWLPSGDTITASTFTVTPSGALTVSDSSFNTTTTTVWLAGGVAEQVYTVTNHITTSAGRQDDRSLTIKVKDL